MNQIDLVHLRQDLEIAMSCADRAQKRIDRLLREYGQGARPSWVSTDLALEGETRDHHMREARVLRRKIERLTAKQ